ncbi:MAG: MFS transporter [Nanoarchaeota archaeon]|nr:MFS transporter [Nanoarchaeota archaeon]
MNPIKRGIFSPKPIDRLGLIALITAIGTSAVGTIWAIYLESILKNPSYVGFLVSFFAVIAFVAYFFLIPIIEKHNKVWLFAISLFLYALSYYSFSRTSNLYFVIFLGMFLSVIASLRITCLGIIVRDKSKDKCVSENEGIIYTSLNIAWLVGPLIAGFVASKYGILRVFTFASIAVFIALILFESFRMRDYPNRKKVDKNVFKIFVEFLRKKERAMSYILGTAINFWWVLIYIYMPIYIVEKNGFGDLVVSYFLAAVIVPLVLSEYSFGKLASKIGFRKIFIYGYALIVTCAIAAFFFDNIYVIMPILVLSSFGAAMIEPTTEAYFFDIIDKQQRDKYYPIYSTSIDSGHFFANMLAAILLLFLPFKFIFLFFGIAMLCFMIVASRIRNVIESRRS